MRLRQVSMGQGSVEAKRQWNWGCAWHTA